MKNINDFIATKKETTETTSDNYEEMANIQNIIRYADFCEIARLKDGTYDLAIERSEYNHSDLEVLETILWDWYKYECQLTEDEIEEELHERARQMMEEIDEAHGRDTMMSLDEYLYHFWYDYNLDKKGITESEKEKIEYLLNQF